MTLKVRTGGAWRDAPALGNVASVAQPVGIRIRDGGSWRHAQRVRIKRTDGGGTPFWHDTGYVGPPWVPVSPDNNGAPRLNWSNYSQLSIGWYGPAGGPSPSTYQVVITNESGGWLGTDERGTGEYTFNISEDTKYMFYVRSKTAFGDYSTWLGPLRVGIGHSQQTGSVLVNRSEGYHAERSLYLWENQVAALVVPGDVNLSTMSWQMSATNGNWGYCSEQPVAGNNYNWRHQIRPIRADVWDSSTGNETMWIGNPESSSMGLGGANGAGKNWGFVGVGYQTNRSVGGDYTQFGFMPAAQGYPGCPDSVVGAMSVDGTRYWQEWQTQVTRNEQGNYYW